MGVEGLGAAEASLLEHYLDTVEHLPDDVQRTISQLREIDQHYQHVLGELERMMCQKDTRKALLQKQLVRAQELADEKLHHMSQLIDTIENKSRQLEHDARTLDRLHRHHSPLSTFTDCLSKERLLDRSQNSPSAGNSSDDNSNQNVPNNSNSSSINSSNGPSNAAHGNILSNSAHPNPNSSIERNSQPIGGKHKDENPQLAGPGGKRARRAAAAKDYNETTYDKREKRGTTQQTGKIKRNTNETAQGRKRKSARQQEVISPDAIDPDEPIYCICQQVSFGEMICCDNEECRLEWFHFQCVSLSTKPKGKWFCPRCRGDRSNQMKKTV